MQREKRGATEAVGGGSKPRASIQERRGRLSRQPPHSASFLNLGQIFVRRRAPRSTTAPGGHGHVYELLNCAGFVRLENNQPERRRRMPRRNCTTGRSGEAATHLEPAAETAGDARPSVTARVCSDSALNFSVAPQSGPQAPTPVRLSRSRAPPALVSIFPRCDGSAFPTTRSRVPHRQREARRRSRHVHRRRTATNAPARRPTP